MKLMTRSPRLALLGAAALLATVDKAAPANADRDFTGTNDAAKNNLTANDGSTFLAGGSPMTALQQAVDIASGSSRSPKKAGRNSEPGAKKAASITVAGQGMPGAPRATNVGITGSNYDGLGVMISEVDEGKAPIGVIVAAAKKASVQKAMRR